MGAHLLYKISPGPADPTFKYQALSSDQPSIRLLTLLPNVGGNPVHCSLTNYIWDPTTGFIKLTDITNDEKASPSFKQSSEDGLAITSNVTPRPRPYEAVSYTWGDTDQFYRITVSDQTFSVTRNLLEALFYLRDQNSSRTLWVDAICINQSDMGEKDRQIRQMNHIYEHATRVVIWLGVPIRNTELAFDFVEKLYNCFPREARRGSEGELRNERGGELPNHVIEASIRHLIHVANAREWLALHNLFKREYWARAWVFQELIMAKESIVVCGPKSAKWGPMEIAMKIVWSTGVEVRDLINSAVPIPDQQTLFPVDDQNPHKWYGHYNKWLLGLHEGRIYKKRSSIGVPYSQTMERWLELAHNRVCKYPHDKIYSILGIAPEPFSKMIPEPNYALPAQEIYKQSVRAFVYGTGSLNILCFSHHSDTQDDLPSWTLDWRRQKRLFNLHDIAWGISTPSQRLWHWNSLKRYYPQFSDNLTIFFVHGINLGKIRSTKIEHELLPNLQKTSNFESEDSRNPGSHHGGHIMETWAFDQDTTEALSLILGPQSPMVLEDAPSTLLYMLLLRGDPARLKSYMYTRKDSDFADELRVGDIGIVPRLVVYTRCRTVVETDTLEIALAPYWTQPDDIICQFFGCTAPIVLRSQDGGKYKFIGDCYVLGKMGQAMIEILEEAMKKPETVEKFDLV